MRWRGWLLGESGSLAPRLGFLVAGSQARLVRTFRRRPPRIGVGEGPEVAFFFLLSGFYYLAVDFELREVRGGPFGEDSADGAPLGGEMKTATAD